MMTGVGQVCATWALSVVFAANRAITPTKKKWMAELIAVLSLIVVKNHFEKYFFIMKVFG